MPKQPNPSPEISALNIYQSYDNQRLNLNSDPIANIIAAKIEFALMYLRSNYNAPLDPSLEAVPNRSLLVYPSLDLLNREQHDSLEDFIKNAYYEDWLEPKVIVCFLKFKEKFKEIVYAYQDVFSEVKDIYFKPASYSRPVSELYFQVRGSNREIPERHMSSGMRRTFWHLAELKLAAPGSVFLIDEFENSLGLNCIGVVAEELLDHEGQYQFIATSHHPHIINKIPPEYWKIITRNEGVITAQSAADARAYDPKSYRSWYDQLARSTPFVEGIKL